MLLAFSRLLGKLSAYRHVVFAPTSVRPCAPLCAQICTCDLTHTQTHTYTHSARMHFLSVHYTDNTTCADACRICVVRAYMCLCLPTGSEGHYVAALVLRRHSSAQTLTRASLGGSGHVGVCGEGHLGGCGGAYALSKYLLLPKIGNEIFDMG